MSAEGSENGVADGTTDVPDTQCDGGNSSNQLVGACDLRDNGTGENDGTDACGGYRDNDIHRGKIVRSSQRYQGRADSHYGGEQDHEFANSTISCGYEEQADNRAQHNAETDGE